jgi:hypothetical protein
MKESNNPPTEYTNEELGIMLNDLLISRSFINIKINNELTQFHKERFDYLKGELSNYLPDDVKEFLFEED